MINSLSSDFKTTMAIAREYIEKYPELTVMEVTRRMISEVPKFNNVKELTLYQTVRLAKVEKKNLKKVFNKTEEVVKKETSENVYRTVPLYERDFTGTLIIVGYIKE